MTETAKLKRRIRELEKEILILREIERVDCALKKYLKNENDRLFNIFEITREHLIAVGKKLKVDLPKEIKNFKKTGK